MTAQDSLAGRYGTPAPWRRRAILAGSILVSAVFLAWLGWTTWSHSTPAVDSELVSFTIDDEHSATAQVEVRLRSDDIVASCLLRAFAEDHSVVGELVFRPDPADGERLEKIIRTERRATSVELLGCTAPDQPRPR